MKISFVLPSNSDHPIGGFKVVYEYANMFAAQGDDVTINFTLYDKVPNKNIGLKAILGKIKRNILFRFGILVGSKREVTWFKLDKRIHLNFVLPDNRYFPDSDVVVATAWTTAYTVNKLAANKGKKVYFIQHDERIFGPSDLVKPTWEFQMKRIVVASWLKELLDTESGVDSEVVQNFVDSEEFNLTRPIEDRKNVVSLLNHKNPFKGTADGIEALKRVHEVVPDLKVNLFGTPDKPENLPDYFYYTQKATVQDLNKIYNESAIYLFPSHIEGWGLTATEAMMCGAALVSTKNGGVNDFGIDNVTALLSDVNDVEQLTRNLVYLLKNAEKRIELSKNGYSFVNQLSKARAFERMNNLFVEFIAQ